MTPPLPLTKMNSPSKWDGKDEDELTEAIEAAESESDFLTVVSIMSHVAGSDAPDDFMTVAEAACDALLRCSAPTGGNSGAAGEAGACDVTLAVMTTYLEEVG